MSADHDPEAERLDAMIDALAAVYEAEAALRHSRERLEALCTTRHGEWAKSKD